MSSRVVLSRLVDASLPMEVTINISQITRKCKLKTDEDGKSRPGEDLYRTGFAIRSVVSIQSLDGSSYTFHVFYVIDNNPPPCYTESAL